MMIKYKVNIQKASNDFMHNDSMRIDTHELRNRDRFLRTTNEIHGT